MAEHAKQVLTALLVLRAQGGERDAVELLAKLWHAPLKDFAQRQTGQLDAADDVMQEAWLGILRGLPGLEDPERFPAWAYRIVRVACAGWVRARAKQRAREAPAERAEDRAQPVAPGETSGDVRAALRRMPEDRRAILELKYVDGFRVDEIAEVLGIPAGTVKSRLFEARQQLKELLERTVDHGQRRQDHAGAQADPGR